MKKLFLLILVGVMAQGCIIVDDMNCRPSSFDYIGTERDCYWDGEWVRVCDDWECWEEYDEVRVCDSYDICRDGSRRY